MKIVTDNHAVEERCRFYTKILDVQISVKPTLGLNDYNLSATASEATQSDPAIWSEMKCIDF
ncbi:hypothetical protein [Parasutterella sp.]|jgi:hypothetical protein|uniref:hypothetical protein n=1 Tax=Parasutterella sp. TaxID=2049037 RepID=UPI003522AF30